jgi:hypothetical protein
MNTQERAIISYLAIGRKPYFLFSSRPMKNLAAGILKYFED